MKKLVISLVIVAALTSPVLAQDKGNLTIEVKGINSNKGTLLVSLWNDSKKFLGKNIPVLDLQQPAKKGNITVTANFDQGEYAASVLHDTNNNKDMDVNLFGYPAESYGFSNDAMGNMGPPAYEKAVFTVTANTRIVINMK